MKRSGPVCGASAPQPPRQQRDRAQRAILVEPRTAGAEQGFEAEYCVGREPTLQLQLAQLSAGIVADEEQALVHPMDRQTG